MIPSLPAEVLCSKMQDMQLNQKTSSRQTSDLIKKLEQYRLENRITQQELAEKIGVNFSTVSRWLNDKTKPNKIQQYHIEKFLKKKIGSKKKTWVNTIAGQKKDL